MIQESVNEETGIETQKVIEDKKVKNLNLDRFPSQEIRDARKSVPVIDVSFVVFKGHTNPGFRSINQ